MLLKIKITIKTNAPQNQNYDQNLPMLLKFKIIFKTNAPQIQNYN